MRAIGADQPTETCRAINSGFLETSSGNVGRVYTPRGREGENEINFELDFWIHRTYSCVVIMALFRPKFGAKLRGQLQ